MRPDDLPDREALVLGEVPQPREGVATFATLRERAADDDALARLDERELHERQIRLGRPGEMLGHYTNGAAAFEHILPERRLRLSAFERMDDPRENREWVTSAGHVGPFGTAGSLEEVRKALGAVPKIDLRSLMTEADQARMRHTKLLCLAGDTTERGSLEDFHRAYARPRMWEQYAEHHRGVCLLFDHAELHKTIMPQLEEHGRCWNGNVAYDNATVQAGGTGGYHLSYNELFAAGAGDIDAGIRAHLDKHHRLLFFTKMDDYREEREVRYAVLDGREDPFLHVEYGRGLRAVVLGVDFPDSLVERAMAICDEADVALRRMAWPHYGPLAVPFD